MRVAALPKLLLTCLIAWSQLGQAEALTTTLIGLGTRTVTVTRKASSLPLSSDTDPSVPAEPGAAPLPIFGGETSEDLAGALVCQRTTAKAAVGLEFGAGGCLMTGGTWTFGQAVSMNGVLLYYPYDSRGSVRDDDSLRMAKKGLGDVYVMAQLGFAKITHGTVPNVNTSATISSDVLETGGGLGYSYRAFPSIAIGAEGSFLFGTILSDAASGTVTTLQIGSSLTFYF